MRGDLEIWGTLLNLVNNFQPFVSFNILHSLIRGRVDILPGFLAAYNTPYYWDMGITCNLEVVEKLTPEGRKYLLESLKQQIADSEAEYTTYLLRCLS